MHVRLGRGTISLDQPVELDLGHDPLTDRHPDALHEARRLLDRRAKLRNEPVVAPFDEIGTLAVTGDRERAQAWTRALLSQLAAFRAPPDLRVLTCFDAEAPSSGSGASGCLISAAMAMHPSTPRGRRSWRG